MILNKYSINQSDWILKGLDFVMFGGHENSFFYIPILKIPNKLRMTFFLSFKIFRTLILC